MAIIGRGLGGGASIPARPSPFSSFSSSADELLAAVMAGERLGRRETGICADAPEHGLAPRGATVEARDAATRAGRSNAIQISRGFPQESPQSEPTSRGSSTRGDGMLSPSWSQATASVPSTSYGTPRGDGAYTARDPIVRSDEGVPRDVASMPTEPSQGPRTHLPKLCHIRVELHRKLLPPPTQCLFPSALVVSRPPVRPFTDCAGKGRRHIEPRDLREDVEGPGSLARGGRGGCQGQVPC